MMKKLRFIGLISVLLILFSQPVIHFISEMILNHYMLKYLGESLHYHKAYWQGKNLVIEHPHLIEKYHFFAEKMKVSYEIKPFSRRVHLSIELDQPIVQLDSVDLKAQQWQQVLTREEPWIHVDTSLKVTKGIVKWDFSDQIKGVAYLDLEGNNRDGGVVKVCFDSVESGSNAFNLSVVSQDQAMIVEGNFDQLQCAKWMEILSIVVPTTQVWQISSGTLDGDFKMIFSSIQKPYLEGHLILDRFQFKHLNKGIEGNLEQVQLNLHQNYFSQLSGYKPFPVCGDCVFLKPASISCFNENHLNWKIENILGSIVLNESNMAKVEFSGKGMDERHSSDFKLQGEIHPQDSLHLAICCLSPEKEKREIRLLIQQSEHSPTVAEVECKQLSFVECHFIQQVFALGWPSIQQVQFQEGTLNGKVCAELSRKGLEYVRFKDLKIKNMQCLIVPWKMNVRLEKCSVKGSVDLLAKDVWQSMHADIGIENGQFGLEDLNSQLYPLKEIHTRLSIQQGSLHPSLVNFRLGALKGRMEINWERGHEHLSATLEGQAQELAEILPITLQRGLQSHFKDHPIGISTHLYRKKEGYFALEGVMHIKRNGFDDAVDLLHFGWELNRKNGDPRGWFYAKQLPLEKFLAPFIFESRLIQLTGLVELNGSFDLQEICMHYQANPIKIEHHDFMIHIHHDSDIATHQLSGFHRIDLRHYTHEGTFPIQQAEYLEKKTGLVFNGIQGKAYFKDQSILFSPLEGYCEEMYLKGKLHLDYSNPIPQLFKLQVSIPEIVGKLSQLQRILSRCKQVDIFNQVVIEGEIEGRGTGLLLSMDFRPEGCILTAEMEGSIGNGSIGIPHRNETLQGLDTHFYYDYGQEYLEFRHIQGTLLLGKPDRAEELSLSGETACFRGRDLQNVELDLSLWDKKDCLLRIAGYTERKEFNIKHFILNKNVSHLAHVVPHHFEWQFRNLNEIQSFKLAVDFNLQSIWQDVKRLICLGCSTTPWIVKNIQEIERAEGKGLFAMEYETGQNRFIVKMEGQKFKFNQTGYDHVSFKGSKLDNHWLIDHLQVDNLALSADVQKWEDRWKVGFLGLEYGQALLLGLEGEFKTEEGEGYLDGKVHLIEVDFSHLDKHPLLKEKISQWKPKGFLKGKGAMQLRFLPQSPWYQIQADLQVHVQDPSLRGCPFWLTNPISIHVQSNQEVQIDSLKGGFSNPLTSSCFFFDSIQLNWLTRDFRSPQLHFSIPSSLLKGVGDTLYKHFPDIMNQQLHKILVFSKKEGLLEGTLSLEKKEGIEKIQLTLEEGLYTFNKRDYHVRDFQLSAEGDQFQFSCLAKQDLFYFSVKGKGGWPTCDKGEWIIKDLSSQAYGSLPPLEIIWQDHPKEGFLIHSMVGYFAGLDFALERAFFETKVAPWSVLQGSVDINFSQLSSFLSPEWKEKIECLELGPIYSLKGMWWVHLNSTLPLLDRLYFQGYLKGSEAILKGYQFANVEAEMQYAPSHLFIRTFRIEDPALTMTCQDIQVFRDEKKPLWKVYFPQMEVMHLQPKLLRKWGQKGSSKFKTLLIRRLKLNHFSGILTDFSTWQASGYFHFLNLVRKNLYHPLLAIPAEIILRLGLDPQVLNPVTGTVYFSLVGDRFYLNRFKDVYSEGRGSKFYLAHEEIPSWVDFKGNMFVQIKMKQYNLIFKLAELFTVTMQGHIKKPRYTLKKQGKSLRHLPILSF
jgi:hypothetical protein